jgi:phosphoribosylaminoimidazole-succinocarboxamide synthase
MIDHATLRDLIPQAITGVQIEWPYPCAHGKVRDLFSLPDARRILVATDRLSAFDRVLTAVPFKGQVLNQLSAFWFERTVDVLPNHLMAVPDPNVSLVRACTTLPVEVIVRGYITGVTSTSLWTLYAAGERRLYGYHLPEGLNKNDPLPEPLITPTTKAGAGQHDERLTCAEVVERGFVDAGTWEVVQAAALAIFRRGQEIARAAGFVLVDTKYEFGRAPDGTLMVIDEIHTPDSSRFWTMDGLEQAQRMGSEPEQWDKEYTRLWYVQQGYRGDGDPPRIRADVIVGTAYRYIALCEGLMGKTFEPASYPALPRLANALRAYLNG